MAKFYVVFCADTTMGGVSLEAALEWARVESYKQYNKEIAVYETDDGGNSRIIAFVTANRNNI